MGAGSGPAREPDRAVSAVLAVVFMVAIVVIAGSFVGAHALGLLDGVLGSQSPQAAFVVEGDGGGVTVTHRSGRPFEASNTDRLAVTVTDADGGEETFVWAADDGGLERYPVAAGDTLRVGPGGDATPSFALEPGDEVRVTWRKGDESLVLAERTVGRPGTAPSLTWNAASDWDGATSDGVVHGPTGDPGTVRLGASPSAPGLVAYYPFEETSGTTAADVRNGYDGAIRSDDGSGPTLGAPGILGTRAYDFSRTSLTAGDYVELPSGLAGRLDSGSFTWSGWVYPERDDKAIPLAANRDANGNRVVLYVQNGRLRVAGGAGGSIAIPTDDWSFVAVTYDADTGTARFYRDSLSRSGSGNAIRGSDQLNVAREEDSDANDYFEGRIDDVRVYDRALSDAEVTSLADPTAGTLETATMSFGAAVPGDSLSLNDVQARPNGGSIEVRVVAVTGSGPVESDPITVTGGQSTYDVSFPSDPTTDQYRVVVELSVPSPGADSPTVSGFALDRS